MHGIKSFLLYAILSFVFLAPGIATSIVIFVGRKLSPSIEKNTNQSILCQFCRIRVMFLRNLLNLFQELLYDIGTVNDELNKIYISSFVVCSTVPYRNCL